MMRLAGLGLAIWAAGTAATGATLHEGDTWNYGTVAVFDSASIVYDRSVGDYVEPQTYRATYGATGIEFAADAPEGNGSGYVDPRSGRSGLSVSQFTSNDLSDPDLFFPFDITLARVTTTDVLTFDFGGRASGLVSYSFGVDGILANRGDDTLAFGGVAVFDVTARDPAFTWTTDGGEERGGDIVVAHARDRISLASAGHGVYGSVEDQDRNAPFRAIINATSQVDALGTPSSVEFQAEGAFEAIAGRRYAFLISLTAFSSVFNDNARSYADLSSTGTFAFAGLSGGTFSSASGQFLAGAAPAAVPLPAGLPLLLSALAGLGVLARRRPA